MSTSSWQETELAPNQILVKGDVHTLVEGETDWSFVEYNTPHAGRKRPSWHDHSIFLCCKGRPVAHFLRQKTCLVLEHDHHVKYQSLAEAVKTYKTYGIIQGVEQRNQREGIEGDSWCQERGTPLIHLALTLALTKEESTCLDDIARTQQLTPDQVVLLVVRTLLREFCEVPS